ncbi:hypothetical protein [Vibrio diabolicus]|uniref:hypothetical protein n=1 Tax=Vibrio diabolicus TaxID=50719 RepID=UPI003751AE5B
MKKSTTIAIDLAKHSFQVCKLHGRATAYFAYFLTKQNFASHCIAPTSLFQFRPHATFLRM